MPLQFHEASQGAEIWTGSQNTGPTGWVDQAGADVERNLLIEGVFCGVEKSGIRALRNGPAGQFSRSGSGSGGLATIDDGSTLKPTYGLVSARGVIPDSWSFDHVGPMCRTVTDTALLLSAIGGYDPDDSPSIDVPPRNYLIGLRARMHSLRLGIPHSPFNENLDREIDAAVRRALEVLSHLTEGSQEVKLPPTPDLFSSVAGAEAYAFHASNLAKTPELYDAETRKDLQEGAKVSMAEYMQGRRDLDRMRRIIGKVFASVDLLVTPTVPKPPLAIAECREAFQMVGHTGEFNIFGLPAISIPCGFTSSGLPIGLQISGPRLGEVKVFALAYAYEQATDWHRRRPVL
jgi:aspartyl-tRNA(Asn)/glutamyl-tRNA(Gln) amidotransferase subunit A